MVQPDKWSPARMRSAISTPVTPKTWYGVVRDRLIANGLWSSSTAVSQLFDSLHEPTKVLLVGLDAAGKTSLLYKYLSQNLGKDVYTKIPIIGVNVEELRYSQVCFYTLDVGGGRIDLTRRFEMALFNMCDAIVFVVDATDHDRLVEAREELLRGFGGYDDDKGIRYRVPVLVLANKQRTRGASTPEEIERLLLGKYGDKNSCTSQLIGVRPWHVAGVDGHSGDGVREAFEWLSDVLKGKPTKQDMREVPWKDKS